MSLSPPDHHVCLTTALAAVLPFIRRRHYVTLVQFVKLLLQAVQISTHLYLLAVHGDVSEVVEAEYKPLDRLLAQQTFTQAKAARQSHPTLPGLLEAVPIRRHIFAGLTLSQAEIAVSRIPFAATAVHFVVIYHETQQLWAAPSEKKGVAKNSNRRDLY